MMLDDADEGSAVDVAAGGGAGIDAGNELGAAWDT